MLPLSFDQAMELLQNHQIKDSVDKTLELITRRAEFRSARVLPTRGPTPSREGNRCCLLASMNVDRAYSGKTGNQADCELAKLCHITERRLSMADRIHCIASCATKAWFKER